MFHFFFISYTALIEDIVTNQKPLEGLSLNLLKEALINTRQHEAFLSILLVSSDSFAANYGFNIPVPGTKYIQESYNFVQFVNVFLTE